MITLAICDDEPFILETLHKSVSRYLTERRLEARIRMFTSGEGLLNSKSDFDIILLDMKLPRRNGLEVARQLRRKNKSSRIIFITSYQEYAYQAFRVDAIHYLLKPASDEDLFYALDKALKQWTENDYKTLTISKGSLTQVVFIRDILYCEAIDHKIYVHTISGDYDYFGTLETLHKTLDERFFRCHRSYLVNLSFVTGRQKDMITMVGGGTALVSRRKRQEFIQKLLAFLQKDRL